VGQSPTLLQTGYEFNSNVTQPQQAKSILILSLNYIKSLNSINRFDILFEMVRESWMSLLCCIYQQQEKEVSNEI